MYPTVGVQSTTNLEFDNELSLDEWYRCVISCERNSIYIKIINKSIVLIDRSWNIPLRLPNIEKLDINEKSEKFKIPPWVPINFYNGSIGFRNSRYEKALIRDVLVQEL